MEQYNVTGMSCAACSARVEKAVSKVPGVTSCSVSLLTNSMGVEGTASPESIIRAVKDAGYGASLKGAQAAAASAEAGGSRDAGAEKAPDRLRGLPAGADVLFHGAHDVELASAEVVRGQSCGDGPGAAAACRDYHGHQSEVFYQRF